MGYCRGLRTTAGRFQAGPRARRGYSLSFFPDDYLLFVDESHVTVPQVRGMFAGEHKPEGQPGGARFPASSALDNRPLKFDEWEQRINQVVYVSATPAPYELGKVDGQGGRAGNRPTGLLDPEIEVYPARGQVPHLLEQIRQRAAVGQRVLVTTLTKRLARGTVGLISKQDARCSGFIASWKLSNAWNCSAICARGLFDVLWG